MKKDSTTSCSVIDRILEIDRKNPRRFLPLLVVYCTVLKTSVVNLPTILDVNTDDKIPREGGENRSNREEGDGKIAKWWGGRPSLHPSSAVVSTVSALGGGGGNWRKKRFFLPLAKAIKLITRYGEMRNVYASRRQTAMQMDLASCFEALNIVP